MSQEVSGNSVRFRIPDGAQVPFYPDFDSNDGHGDSFFFPSSPFVNISTITPSADRAVLARFHTSRGGRCAGGAFILDTPSISGSDGEVALYDGTLANRLATTGIVDLDLDGTAGVKPFTFVTPATLEAGGVYYVAFKSALGDFNLNAALVVSNLVAELFGATVPNVLMAAKTGLAGALPSSITNPGSQTSTFCGRLDL